jgi:PAS domain-containing protein
MENIDEVLQKAVEALKEPDYLVDLFDMTFVWASPKGMALTGYTQEDIGKMRNIDIIAFNENLTEEQFRQELGKRLRRGHGEMELPVKKTNGEIITLKIEYQVIKHNNGWYIAGKFIA